MLRDFSAYKHFIEIRIEGWWMSGRSERIELSIWTCLCSSGRDERLQRENLAENSLALNEDSIFSIHILFLMELIYT